MESIDFVITWVDNNDPMWISEKAKWSETTSSVDRGHGYNLDCRYRSDDELLRYWFRSVEPFWLNESNAKLHIVSHVDYIPSQYLPTFSSITIELNLHRIKDLSEHFVLFNDDIFLLQPLKPNFFFKGGYLI